MQLGPLPQFAEDPRKPEEQADPVLIRSRSFHSAGDGRKMIHLVQQIVVRSDQGLRETPEPREVRVNDLQARQDRRNKRKLGVALLGVLEMVLVGAHEFWPPMVQ